MDSETCLNMIQTKQPCTVCKEICPNQVFHGEDPNWDVCDGCGVCVAHCPTRCLRPSSLLSERILELCRRVTGDVTFSCSEQENTADLKAPCLSALPWELIALFALDGTVTLAMNGCEACPKRGLLCHFEQTLASIRLFLGDERFQASVVRCSDSTVLQEENERTYSRRDAFRLAFTKSKAAATGLLPENKELSPDGMLCRHLLAHRLRQFEPVKSDLSLPVPEFTETCTACGLCTKVCPAQALHRMVDETEDGRKNWYMALIPWRCTACGLCSVSCPTESLAEPHWKIHANVLAPVLHPVDAVPCPRCGEPMPPEQATELCPRCQAEASSPFVW